MKINLTLTVNKDGIESLSTTQIISNYEYDYLKNVFDKSFFEKHILNKGIHPIIEFPVCKVSPKLKLKIGGKKRKGIKPIIEIKKIKKIKRCK